MRNIIAIVTVLSAILLALAPVAAAQEVPESRINDMYITAEVANVRSQPNLTADVVTTVARDESVRVVEPVAGEAVDGNTTWYRTESGYYISETVTVNEPVTKTFVFNGPRSERWIDIDLSTLTARAMQGDASVYEAPIASGREEFQTPTGEFRIEWRAKTRTMDSSTIGIPLDSEKGYLVPNVRYAQYFTLEGDAIHGNYWVPPSAFGNAYSSHGCVGMSNEDAKAFWDFAEVGTRVVVHE